MSATGRRLPRITEEIARRGSDYSNPDPLLS
jgi:hypothetical protein